MDGFSTQTRVLVIDDDPYVLQHLERLFSRSGHDVDVASTGAAGLEMLNDGRYDAVFLDLVLPDIDGLQLLRRLRARDSRTPVVLITGYASVQTAVEAMRQGAYDYLPKPLDSDQVLRTLDKILERRRILMTQQGEKGFSVGPGRSERIVTRSPRMLDILELIDKVAPTDSTVLIIGESGTGKELVAKAIHYRSLRRDRPFVTVDCGAIVETLFESELFGHEKGAFTGAAETKLGSFELADGGTFFFDEIGNISLNVQAKILRAIQEKEIRRVGGTSPINVDVRVVAATNLDLRRAVEKGTFREDLFYRLTVFPLHLPALRERREDILLLAEYFLERFASRMRKPVVAISEEVQQVLLRYDWPGNVRELENTIERAMVLEESTTLQLSSLPEWIVESAEQAPPGGAYGIRPLWQVERDHIEQTLRRLGWNKAQAAKALGIDRKTLYAKLERYGLAEKAKGRGRPWGK